MLYHQGGSMLYHQGEFTLYPRLGASALHNKTSAEHRGLAGILKAKKAGWQTLRQKLYVTGVVGRSTSNHIGNWK